MRATTDIEDLLGQTPPGSSVVFALSFCTPEIVAASRWICFIREAADRMKQIRIYIVAGGPHPSGDPDSCLRMGVDGCVIGAGELAFLGLLEALASGDALGGLPGVVTRIGQSAICSPEVDLDGYLPAYPEAGLYAPVEITRGCPQGCAFCQTGRLFGTQIRHRSLDTLARWFREVRARGHTICRFIAPNAFAYGSDRFDCVDLSSLEALLRRASETMGRDRVYFGGFPSEVWPTSVTREAVRLVKGFTATRRLVMGAQSGSQAVLDRVHRRHSLDDVERAVGVILAEGLAVDVDFIVGFPDETDEERAESLEFMRGLIQMGARIHTHTFLPLAGTPLYNRDASAVDPDTRRGLEQLASSGFAFGQWRTQEKQGREIPEFLRTLRP
jgi:B12-binding domain/radical SAM domain protein